jgi:hypothetical protein
MAPPSPRHNYIPSQLVRTRHKDREFRVQRKVLSNVAPLAFSSRSVREMYHEARVPKRLGRHAHGSSARHTHRLRTNGERAALIKAVKVAPSTDILPRGKKRILDPRIL